MRLPLAQQLTTRDGLLTKDSKVVNGFVESKGEQSAVFRRPGLTLIGTMGTGTAQGLVCWQSSPRAIIGDVLETVGENNVVDSFTATKYTNALVNSSWSGIAYGNSLWVTTGGTKAGVSSDLQTWTETTLPTSSNYGGVAYGNGTFCTASYSTAKSATSTDGLTWSSTGSFPLTAGAIRMTYGSSNFVALQGTATTDYATSTNGQTWTSRTMSWSVSVTSVASSGTTIIGMTSGTSYAIRSTDGGVTFNRVAMPSNGSWYVAYGDGIWVAVKGSSTAAAYSLDDGLSWTSSTLPQNVAWQGIANNGTGFVAVVTSSTVAAYTVDGINWSQQVMPSGGWVLITANETTGQFGLTSARDSCSIAIVTSSGPTATSIPVTAPGFQYDLMPTGASDSNQWLMLKNPYEGFYFNGTTVTKISDVDYPSSTVPGIAYLDSTFYVMDSGAKIYGSELGDPSSWSALNYIVAEVEPGDGVALAKSANYVVAFKEWSTEFFYDAANPTGSPLSPVLNGFTLIGCASGYSVAQVDKMTFWIAQTHQKGRCVYMMIGTDQTPISTPDVERVLALDNLSTVYAYGLRIAGHIFYILTLVNTTKTLVYDVSAQNWYQWTSLTAATAVSVSSIVRVDTLATVTTATAHGLSDGDPVTIAGASQSDYNGLFQAKYINTTSFSIVVSGSPVTPATGTITSTGYTESYFNVTKYTHCSSGDLGLKETGGTMYRILPNVYLDDTVPINTLIRTLKFDGGSTAPKREGRCEVIGNKISDVCMIRHSDDDYQTNSPYRYVDLNAERSQIWRQGRFRRRSYELRFIGNNQMQLSNLELDLE